MHHYITKYTNEENERKAVSWIQINLFHWNFCLLKREINLHDA